ncbi:P-loop containing nucleoside triphosphate hydrolase protein [Echria macrotheca]|uniref:P-loop containing nucleoside triphosphate hydrolase protein n=1 Tax=Echria macrotheca TaxID=438768 RepID=A0AAJ0B5P3_9PEZI|nr:P-loop containing nucleoside triphosphate hydrolase protein [Echria macrotheca]
MMDYHAIHGHDVSSFDLPSTHRLPTVSAAQALQDLEAGRSTSVPTGLEALDCALRSGLDDTASGGGIQKGHVTEIWGPPGVGKSTFGMQIAARCLNQGEGVVWVDNFHPVSIPRLRAIVGSATSTASLDQVEGFVHYTCPNLPHFIALLCRPTTACIPQGTSLVVIDSLSALVNYTFPKPPDGRGNNNTKGGKDTALPPRRPQVLQHIIGALQKLAATRDIAVVLLTQSGTKVQIDHGATLVPSVNATVWDQGISTRLVLFRDWPSEGESRGLHLVGVQKKNGTPTAWPTDNLSAYRIDARGLVSVDYDDTTQNSRVLSTPALKRKLGETDFEIADSEDEDYGWQDGDEDTLPPMPSQWQGSEDILLRPELGSDEAAEDDDQDASEQDQGEQFQDADSG